MASIEDYLEQADELAQDILYAWQFNVSAGDPHRTPGEFEDVLDKARRYIEAKRVAEDRRRFNFLTVPDSIAEADAHRAFAEACKAFYENIQSKARSAA